MPHSGPPSKQALEQNGLVEYGRTATFTGLREAGPMIVPLMVVIMIGGSFIKAVIPGTVATTTMAANLAMGFAIFYMMVNIGAFSGKTTVKPLRESMGDLGLINLNYFAAEMTFLAFVSIFLFFKISIETRKVNRWSRYFIYGKVVEYLDKKNALAAPPKTELVADVS